MNLLLEENQNMKQSDRSFELYFSPLLVIPYFNALIYMFQISILKLFIRKKIYLCHGNNKWEHRLVSLIPADATIYCKSADLGRTLAIVPHKKIFDNPRIDTKHLTVPSVYVFMWTLVFCQYVTKKTKRLLKGIIPDDYPEC